MRLVVTLEHRFKRTPNGEIWTKGSFAYTFWTRYLDVFDTVCPAARVSDAVVAQSGWARADGPGVEFIALPNYIGPIEYLGRAWPLRNVIRRMLASQSATILRVPSWIGAIVHRRMHSQNRPFGVEVVGNPHDSFSPGAIKHPMRQLFRWVFNRQLKNQCREAVAAAYVTSGALQKSYPPSQYAFRTDYSSVELPDYAFAKSPHLIKERGPYTLIFVGTLAQLYKAPNILLEAMAVCIEEGLNINLVVVGEGKHRNELELQTINKGIQKNVEFTGQIAAGLSVRNQLDSADLFVLPSRQEGLPRAMIEAMARGLPCIGSKVGGIPELLPPEDMVESGNAKELAAKIKEVIISPDRMRRMAARNLEVARRYHEDILRPRRVAFYRTIKERTEEWLRRVQ